MAGIALLLGGVALVVLCTLGLIAFTARPKNPDLKKVKPFDPNNVVTLDLTKEEWEEFDQAIRESRQEERNPALPSANDEKDRTP